MDADGDEHERFMREALSEVSGPADGYVWVTRGTLTSSPRFSMEQGEKALPRGEVPVGAVFVYEGEIIARSANRVNELFDVRPACLLQIQMEWQPIE